jgi:prepilin-type processing-associated H-X9-DG protein
MNVPNRLAGPPMGVSTLTSLATGGGLGSAPYAYTAFGVMSNELSIPRTLVCPSDERSTHSNFVMHVSGTVGSQQAQASNSGNAAFDSDTAYFNNFKLSYFLGVNAADLHPQMFLAGDRNIWGDHTSSTTQPAWNNIGYGNNCGTQYWMGTNWGNGATYPAWSPSKMHQSKGNVLLADGSVQQLDSAHLRQQLSTTGDTTSIPGPNTLLFP